MTRAPVDEAPAPGTAADAGTLRALEFAAIVEQLVALTAFARRASWPMQRSRSPMPSTWGCSTTRRTRRHAS